MNLHRLLFVDHKVGVRFPDSQFCFVVEALYYTRRELFFCTKIVENQLLVTPNHFGKFLKFWKTAMPMTIVEPSVKTVVTEQ